MFFNFLLGRGYSAVQVVIILEFLLAIYSVALVFSTKSKILKIVHILLGVFWVVLGILNIFYR